MEKLAAKQQQNANKALASKLTSGRPQVPTSSGTSSSVVGSSQNSVKACSKSLLSPFGHYDPLSHHHSMGYGSTCEPYSQHVAPQHHSTQHFPAPVFDTFPSGSGTHSGHFNQAELSHSFAKRFRPGSPSVSGPFGFVFDDFTPNSYDDYRHKDQQDPEHQQQRVSSN